MICCVILRVISCVCLIFFCVLCICICTVVSFFFCFSSAFVSKTLSDHFVPGDSTDFDAFDGGRCVRMAAPASILAAVSAAVETAAKPQTPNEIEQTEELEALRSIYPELRQHPKSKRHQIVIKPVLAASSNSVAATADTKSTDSDVLLRRALSVRPLSIMFEFWFPASYPSDAAPEFYVAEADWIARAGMDALRAQLLSLWQEQNGAVVLFVWLQWLTDELMSWLIAKHTLSAPVFESIAFTPLATSDHKTHATATTTTTAAAASAASVTSAAAGSGGSAVAASTSVTVSPARAVSAIDTYDGPTIYHSSEPIRDRKSVFVAHFARVKTETELRKVMAKLYEDRKVAAATHNISAYHYGGGHYSRDDGMSRGL